MTKPVSFVAIALVAAVIASVVPATATPVCSTDNKTACGGRTFPEAANSLSFVQHDSGEYEDGIKALAKAHPDFMRVRKFSKVLDNEKAVSAGGREIWLVEITDFNAPEKGKIPVAASLSVHGVERAGLEGGVRYMEDLVTWADDEPNHILRNGTQKDSVGIPVSKVLKKVHFYLADLNPDGWAAGDLANGGVYSRTNDNGTDLNREFPTMGWTKTSYTPLSDPEAKSWHKLLKRKIRPEAATDIHGELDSANNAFADLMYPAGQWNARRQTQEEKLARHMKSNVKRYFEEDGVAVGAIPGADEGMKPSEYATGYDVVGYDDSGFMGDYFTQKYGALEMDVEHFLSHLVPNSEWIAALEQAHIAAVRGELEALIVEAIVTRKVRKRLALGRTGYLYDPAVVTSKDGYGTAAPPEGYSFKPYRATPMKYFKDLSKAARRRLRKVPSASTYRRGLRHLRTFVIAGKPFPKDSRGRHLKRRKMVKALKAFVRKGGNLILTDRALKMLSKLGIVPKKAVAKQRYNAGHIDIDDMKDPYTRKIHTTASQTYYEVGLGYSADADVSPHWTVAKDAWKKAKGKSVAHITDEERIGLGRVKLGRGTVGIFGAVLPPATEKYDHFYGLADYGVTVAAGRILNNMIRFRRKR